MIFLIFIPCILTLLLLLAIIFINGRKVEKDYLEEEFDDFDDYEFYESLSVAVYGDKAYFVKDNTFYEMETIAEPDFSTVREIDTASLAKKDLDKLFVILDELEDYRRER